MEMEQYPGKHKCGKELNMRTSPLDDDNKKIIGWMIFGICKKCDEAVVMNISKDKEKPVLDRDYTIDYNKIAKGEKLNTKSKEEFNVPGEAHIF